MLTWSFAMLYTLSCTNMGARHYTIEMVVCPNWAQLSLILSLTTVCGGCDWLSEVSLKNLVLILLSVIFIGHV